MSEPARSFPPHEPGGRPAPGPLRDWLSAMRAQVPAEPRAEAPAPRGPESGWSPRLVQPEAAPPAEDPDVTDLMAENLMLKARLRLEDERRDELRSMLAEEIRGLREHVRDEMASLADLRAEQDAVRAERERFREEREALRAEAQALAAERDALREERDLWRARTEALAQPLFQAQRH